MTKLLHFMHELPIIFNGVFCVKDLFKFSACVEISVSLPGVHLVENCFHTLSDDFDKFKYLLELDDWDIDLHEVVFDTFGWLFVVKFLEFLVNRFFRVEKLVEFLFYF